MTTQTMSTVPMKSNLLSQAIRGNSIFSAISGLTALVAAQPLAEFLGIPNSMILTVLGVGLILYAVFLFSQSREASVNRWVALSAIEGDVAWVIGSAVLLFTDWVPFTMAGWWTIAVIADIVAVFAILQIVGLRRQG